MSRAWRLLLNRLGLWEPTLDDLERAVDVFAPGSAIELVGDRRELVIYTGLTVEDDEQTLLELSIEELTR